MDLVQDPIRRTDRTRRFLEPRASSITLITGTALVLATLLALFPHAISNSITFWFALVFVFVFPGFLLDRILFPAEFPWAVSRLPALFVYSLALFAVPATLLQFLGAELDAFRFVYVLILWVLSAVCLARTWGQPVAQAKFAEKEIIVEIILLVLGVIAAMVIANGPRDTDDWTYLAVLQEFIGRGHIATINADQARYSLRYTFHVWLYLQAFLARWIGVDIVTLVREVLPLLLAPLSLLSLYAWGKEFFGRLGAGFLTVIVQLLIYVTFAQADGWGRGFFARVAQDKFLVWLVILPVALQFFWRFISRGTEARKNDISWTTLVAYGMALVAMVWVHPIGLVQLLLAIGGFALINLLQRSRISLRRWALIGLTSVPVFLAPLVIHAITPESIFSITAPAVKALLRLSAGRLVLQPPFYIADPSLFENPIIIFALALVPLLVFRLRSDRRAQFLFGSTVVTLALVFNPYTAWVLGQAITPWQLWRLTWGIPVALLVTDLVVQIAGSIGASASVPATRYSRAAIAYLVVAGIGALLLSNLNLERSVSYLRKPHALDAQLEDVMRALPRVVTDPSIVLVPRDLTRLPAAFSLNAQPISMVAHAPEDPMGAEIDKFYSGDAESDKSQQFLDFYNVNYILVPKGTPLEKQLRADRTNFNERYRNERYALYEVQ